MTKRGIYMIYLDYAATTPISEEALYVFNEASKRFYGNPSSLHELGTLANDALETSRSSWATMIGGEKEGIYFTSGGTEANQLALRSLIEGNRHRGNHFITTEVEHSSIYNLFKKFEKDQYDVTYLSLNENGQIDLSELEKAIRPTTMLVSIQAVNSEIGFIQPIDKIGILLAERDVLFHTDFIQGFGNMPIDVKEVKVDALSVAGHKIYGPKGIGMCYINPRINWESQVPNTNHEGGFRPGTVDVPSVLSFTTAAQQANNNIVEYKEQMEKLRHYFTEQLHPAHFKIYESYVAQLPQIVGFSVAKLQGQYIMLKCNENGIAISTGSACQVGQQSPSRTLRALRKSKEEANQLVRVSFGKETKKADLERLISTLHDLL